MDPVEQNQVMLREDVYLMNNKLDQLVEAMIFSQREETMFNGL